MSSNPFLFPIDQYKRDIDIRQGYREQVAKYISLMRNIPYSQALEFVTKELKSNGKFGLKDPDMLKLQKVARGKRVQQETTFLEYIDDIIDSDRIVSPSMVVYERPEVEKSVTAEWQDDNIAARKKSKKEMFRLKQIGEIVKSQLADYDQNSRKIRINSVSGMRGFKGNPLFLATGHSSLTSLCRAAAGYGNGTVERFLSGSRHYHTAEIAKANILAMVTIENLSRYVPIIEKYELVLPTVDDVMSMVERSTSLYWDTPHELAIIREMVSGLTDLERAVVCYSGDFYHVAKLNPELVRRLMSDLIADDISDVPDVDTQTELKTLDATETAYVNALCANTLMGTTHDLVKDRDPEGWMRIGKTAYKARQALSNYADLINVLFTPNHLPPTVAALKSIQRRASLAADTDSSIFTTEYWVEWYSGHLKRGETEDRIWYLMTYMVCQCIAHALAMLSANVGVEKSMTHRLAMKNEYAFPEFALTNLAKHYWSTMSMREGNVYKELELEIKGVELRGSTAPKHILKATEELMFDIMRHIDRGEQMKAYDVLHRVAGYELDTIRSIMRGEYTYLRSDSVKPNTKKMCYHELWQDVFAPKYGKSVEPPYPCVKISTDLVNKTTLAQWLTEIEDEALQARMAAWLDKYNRSDLKTILLPTMAIKSIGLPVEIQSAANVRRLAYMINSGFYRILEACGLFLVDRNNYRLVYDFLGLKP